jgi:hypothetical protein
MKLTVCLSAYLIALLALAGSARADSSPDNQPDNPYANTDPDGVPLAVAKPDAALTTEQLAALQKEAQQEARNHDWLLLEYEEQVRHHAVQSPDGGKSTDIYLKLRMNPELANLAGLTPIDPEPEQTPGQPPALRASPGPASDGGMALRPGSPATPGGFTPLITPLSPPATQASQQYAIAPFSSSMQSILDAPGPFDAPPAPPPATAQTPARTPEPAADPGDLETPGMVAAKDNTLPGAPDLGLDSLPEQNPDNARNADQAQPAELSQAMDVDQMHLQLDAKQKVAAPAIVTRIEQKPPAPQTVNAPLTPVNPANAPVPINQQPQLSPVHAPVGNPFDILNH